MFDVVVGFARLLDSLCVAKTVYDLVREGYSPTTVYRRVKLLREYGFVAEVEFKGVKHYHITGLGAELLKTLRKAVVYRVVEELEKRKVKYRVVWGEEGKITVKPKIIVSHETLNIPPTYGLVEVVWGGKWR